MAPRSPLSPTKGGIVKARADTHLFEAVPLIVLRNGLFEDLETASVLLDSCEALKDAVALYKAAGPANGQRFSRRQAAGRPHRQPVIRWADEIKDADEQDSTSKNSTAPPSPKKQQAAAAAAEAINKAVASISSSASHPASHPSYNLSDPIAAGTIAAAVTTTLTVTTTQQLESSDDSSSTSSSTSTCEAGPVAPAAPVCETAAPVAGMKAPAKTPPPETAGAVKAAQAHLISELRNRLLTLKDSTEYDNSAAVSGDSCEPAVDAGSKQQQLLAANAMRLAQLCRQLRAVREAASLLQESTSTINSTPTGWPVLHTAARSIHRADRVHAQQNGAVAAGGGSSSSRTSYGSFSSSSGVSQASAKISSSYAGAIAAGRHGSSSVGSSTSSSNSSFSHTSSSSGSFRHFSSNGLPAMKAALAKPAYAKTAADGKSVGIATITKHGSSTGWPHLQTADRAVARAKRLSSCSSISISSKSSSSSNVSYTSGGWPQLKTAARFQARLEKLQQQQQQQQQQQTQQHQLARGVRRAGSFASYLCRE